MREKYPYICGTCGWTDGDMCDKCGDDNWMERRDLEDPSLHDWVWDGIINMSLRIKQLTEIVQRLIDVPDLNLENMEVDTYKAIDIARKYIDPLIALQPEVKTGIQRKGSYSG